MGPIAGVWKQICLPFQNNGKRRICTNNYRHVRGFQLLHERRSTKKIFYNSVPTKGATRPRLIHEKYWLRKMSTCILWLNCSWAPTTRSCIFGTCQKEKEGDYHQRMKKASSGLPSRVKTAAQFDTSARILPCMQQVNQRINQTLYCGSPRHFLCRAQRGARWLHKMCLFLTRGSILPPSCDTKVVCSEDGNSETEFLIGKFTIDRTL